MRLCITAIFLCGLVCAQPPEPAKVPDDAVVATVAGKPITAREVNAIIAGLPPQGMQMFKMNPEVALQQYFVVKHLAEEAEKKGLDKESPNKEQLEFQRNIALMRIATTDYGNHIVVPAADKEKYYREHGEQFEQAKVRVIKVDFSSGQVKSGVKVRTEPEAKARIEDLRKQLAAGADFAKLAKEASDDKESAEKGGEWGIIKRSSKELPDDVMKAIFALKAGEVSQPIKQPNGFYLLKVDEFSKQPYDDVSLQIFNQMQSELFNAWIQGINKSFTVKLENKDFFPRTQPAGPGSR
jgi:peptidyl-prolyl cis-trans isomerase C